jgi:poly-gamma-glutamate capsule biosynthesis protein CapA/YwtB (metallophosphatase superfamily)
MATEPEAKGSDAGTGPLTPAARRRPAGPADPPPGRDPLPPDPPPGRDPLPPDPPPGRDPAWNLSDELEGLEANAEHVDVYQYARPRPASRSPHRMPQRQPAPPGPRPGAPASPREHPGAEPSTRELPAPLRERSTPGVTAAVVSISLVTLAVLLQLASVLSSRSASGAATGGISADASRDAVAPGGRIELAGEGASDRAELVLEVRRRAERWSPVAEGRADGEGRFLVAGRVAAAPGATSLRVRAIGGGVSAPIPVTVRPLRLASVGDINLGDAPGAAIEAEGPAYPWESAGRPLRRADIAFGNLESAVSERGEPFPKEYTFRGTPEALAGLRKHSGIDVLNLANNHVGDFGPTAMLDTVRGVERLGMKAVGAGPTLARALQPQVVERLGLRVAFVGFSNILPLEFAAEPGRPGVAWATPETVAEAVRTARQDADVVVATFHWGIEKAPYETADQAELARIAADAGAQLVIGAHPHVLQPMRRTGAALVAYSLGNFVFGAQSSETAATGVLVTDLSAEGVTGARWRPGTIAGGRPILEERGPQRLPVADPDAMAAGLTLGG